MGTSLPLDALLQVLDLCLVGQKLVDLADLEFPISLLLYLFDRFASESC